MEQKEYAMPFTGVFMLVLDPPLLLALATLIGILSSLVWAFRRRLCSPTRVMMAMLSAKIC